ncbi:MAG: hypothetical protein H0T73_15670 [Ardenticatenales bacterium]|nr:hypothetical protein [Ardenticatenales bacterium]
MPSVPEDSPTLASTRALWGGIAFSLLFTALIAWAGARLDAVPLLPDQGASWYYWKLPEPTLWSRTTSWLFYAAHQISFWGLIYYAQTRVARYSNGLHRANIWALATNAFFIVLHFLQTHLWYDGLAQDVTIWSSQFSVILMLVFILIMENPRRGLFFGRQAPLSRDVTQWLKKYHGYLFAWAAVYTFWYHPMVNTQGHLIGFVYMFFLMVQGSLFLTRAHLNRYWMVTQELFVLFHGTLVAYNQGNGIWPMFFFGFAGMFVITQVHGLGWPIWARWGSVALWLGGAFLLYSSRGFGKIDETIRIPFIEYLLVFLLTWLFAATAWVIRRISPSVEPSAATRPQDVA